MPSDPPHDSAHLHVSGQAQYADDIQLPANALHGAFGLSVIAHGRIALAACAEAHGRRARFLSASTANTVSRSTP